VCALKRRSRPEVENPAAGPTAVIGHPAAGMVTMDMKVLTLFTVRTAQAVPVNHHQESFQAAVRSTSVDMGERMGSPGLNVATKPPYQCNRNSRSKRDKNLEKI